MIDPIVEEIRNIRDKYAAKFNYDLDAMVRDLKHKEAAAGLQFKDGVAKPTNSDEAELPAKQ